MNEIDLAALLLRVALGGTLMAHGWNHGFGPGGLAGTTGWFESIGLRPARLHAAVSSYLEILAGTALVVGLLVPVAAAAGVGTMVVALVTVHRTNGFFIFNEGWEYVAILATALMALATLGGGKVSIDRALDLELHGLEYGFGAAGLGAAGAAVLLAACWRPPTDDRP